MALYAAVTYNIQVVKHQKGNTLHSDILPSLWSDVEQESMNVCATTERQESTILDLWISNTKFGFFIKLTQNRRGKLEKKLIQKIILPYLILIWFLQELPSSTNHFKTITTSMEFILDLCKLYHYFKVSQRQPNSFTGAILYSVFYLEAEIKNEVTIIQI
jgi:hypothetical protein